MSDHSVVIRIRYELEAGSVSQKAQVEVRSNSLAHAENAASRLVKEMVGETPEEVRKAAGSA